MGVLTPGRPPAGPVRHRRHGRRRTATASAGRRPGTASSGCSWPSRDAAARRPRPSTRPSAGFPPGHPPMRSFLGVPVRVGRRGLRQPLPHREAHRRRRSPRPTSRSPRRWPRWPGWRSRTPGWPSGPRPAAGGGRRPPRWPPRCCPAPTPTRCCGRCPRGSSALTDADMAGVLAPSVDDDETHDHRRRGGPRRRATSRACGVPLARARTSAPLHEAGVPRLIEDISTMPVARPARAGGRRADRRRSARRMIAPLGNAPGPGPAGGACGPTGREPFTPDDLDLLSAFAAQASVVLELARAQQRERQLQVQADRDRIARDLHDHVVQRIFATGAVAGPAQPLAAGRAPGGRRAAVARAVDELDGTIARDPHVDLRAAGGRGRLARWPCAGGSAEVVRSVDRGPRRCGRDLRIRGEVDELPPRARARPRRGGAGAGRRTWCGTPSASRVTVAVTVERRGVASWSPTTAAGCRRSPCAAAWRTSPTAPSGGAGG